MSDDVPVCARCQAPVGKRYYQKAPDHGDLCEGCHRDVFPDAYCPVPERPRAKEWTFSIFRCAVCQRMVAAEPDAQIACAGSVKKVHSMTLLVPVTPDLHHPRTA